MSESDEVPLPQDAGTCNIMLRIQQAMNACGIAYTDARWAYMRLFCCVCALRGKLQRSQVAIAMAVLIRDHMHLSPVHLSSCTPRLSYEMTKLRQSLARCCGRLPVGIAAPALRGANADISD